LGKWPGQSVATCKSVRDIPSGSSSPSLAPRNPREIAFFDFNPDGATGSDNWSHYWYEQNPKPGTPVITYGQDGVHNPPTGRGFEVFRALVGIGRRAGVDHLNPQTQEEVLP
jgi:hypothetical protein